jgi:hypothetical protein
MLGQILDQLIQVAPANSRLFHGKRPLILSGYSGIQQEVLRVVLLDVLTYVVTPRDSSIRSAAAESPLALAMAFCRLRALSR